LQRGRFRGCQNRRGPVAGSVARIGKRTEGEPTTAANRDSFEVFEQPIASIICREIVIVE
jgi:hypothetical protein